MIELNPDHRTTAALAVEIQKTVMKTDAPSPHPSPSRGEGKGGGDSGNRFFFTR